MAKKLDEELIAEGRQKSHASAEPANGKTHEPEDQRRRQDGDRRRDGGHSRRDQRERSDSPDRYRDERRRRRHYSRSRSPERDRWANLCPPGSLLSTSHVLAHEKVYGSAEILTKFTVHCYA